VEALTSNALSSAPERRAAEVVATVTFIFFRCEFLAPGCASRGEGGR
jgi:hypothetical protein